MLIDLLIPSERITRWFNKSIVDACGTVKAGGVKTGWRFRR
jgi:hypothetical protein